LWWFRQLRGELAFYVGCLNLAERIDAAGLPRAVPQPAPSHAAALQAHGLYDLTLALSLGRDVVPNDVQADGQRLIVVTGANQGGKTTFLRSVGTAQLMMQAGMFVAARVFRSSVASGVFSHFTRREDAAMRSGKLDEELARLAAITAELDCGALLLLNESFSSTNEREGAEIAEGVIGALIEGGVRIAFVTHLSGFARSLHARGAARTTFLRAERSGDGRRTFRMVEGEPAATSHGLDLYRELVG
jgi:DNA mismatch repair ATPase MutS